MMRTRLILALLLAPVIASGQQASMSLTDWQRNQRNVLAYIEAMPDSALGFQPTPGVRTFAEQFDHIVSTNLEVAAEVRGTTKPVLGDPQQYLHSKSALRAYAEATYAYMLGTLQAVTPAELERPISVYGLPPQSAGRLVQLTLEHSIWTLGQVVPYLRLNGVTPPAYDIPF